MHMQIHCSNKLNASRTFSISHNIHLSALTFSSSQIFISPLLCGLHTQSFIIFNLILEEVNELITYSGVVVKVSVSPSFCVEKRMREHVLHKILKCKIQFLLR